METRAMKLSLRAHAASCRRRPVSEMYTPRGLRVFSLCSNYRNIPQEDFSEAVEKNRKAYLRSPAFAKAAPESAPISATGGRRLCVERREGGAVPDTALARAVTSRKRGRGKKV